ncbi:ferric reductase-like transmembrane domain-containing protein [Trinickia sp. Y13]|uniref:ferredoxin reductase family protein n=1 Tax=Trinickia sp. Y13 TaxID=2917807 RepID=UPI00240519B6|nr:ferric reductase-like transmembrane domain-containing protein [Trinickia sp. Y13]MDG0027306.1 ferric reductase-like transmembrane domain-containing protein [Trinickia sp. Y13]
MSSHAIEHWQRRVTVPAVLVASTLLLAWWAFPGGLPPWRSIGIVSAWIGTGLLTTTTVLMVREPHLTHALGGLEHCYRWHHRAGVAAYFALLAHPLALAMDGVAESPHVAWESLAPWLQAWPVWLGWCALVLLMIGLATTFAPQLSYRRWRGLHTLLGVGTLLAFSHVGVLLGHTAPSLGILGLGVFALAWRVVVSNLGLAARPYRVTAVTHPTGATIEATVSPCATPLAVAPGQFVLAAFGDGPHFHGCGEYHPFTVSRIEAAHQLRLTVKALGQCSQRLQTLEPGVLVRLQGPFGSFLSDIADGPELWIAGGIGVTPFIATLRAQPRNQPTTLIYLYRAAADAAFLDELSQLAANDSKFELLAQATGDLPPNPEPLLAKVTHLPDRRVYLCGPPAMVDTLVQKLLELRVSPRSIHYEHFDFR